MADNNPVAMMLETPLAGLIEQLGLAIANAQFSLDRNAIAIARMLADPEGGIQLPGDDRSRSMLELGFTPSFYHITEATIEARVAFSIGQGRRIGRRQRRLLRRLGQRQLLPEVLVRGDRIERHHREVRVHSTPYRVPGAPARLGGRPLRQALIP